MKLSRQIASYFLMGYFLVLPVLFSFHLTHDHHDEHAHETEGAILGEISTDCDLCHLFESNDVFIEEEIGIKTFVTFPVIRSTVQDDLISIVVTALPLRAPPAV